MQELIYLSIAAIFIGSIIIFYSCKEDRMFETFIGLLLIFGSIMYIEGNKYTIEKYKQEGVIELYKGNYKVEVMNSYVDSVLVKSDTIIVKL